MTYSNPYSIPSTTTNFIPFSGMGMRKNGRAMLLPSNYQGDGSTLSLDFTAMGDVLDPRLTFSRASTATFVNSSGYVQFANANCFTYSNPRNLTTAWNATGTVTWNGTGGIADPIDGTNAQSITFGTAASAIFNTAGTIVTSGITHTFSVWLRAASGTTNARIGSSNTGAVSTVALTTTWQRFSCQYVTNGTNDGGAIYSQTVTATPEIYVWGAQVQPGSIVGDLIQTSGTQNYSTPRFDYSPTNIGEPRGLLVEGSAINYMLQSSSLTGYSVADMATPTAGSEPNPEGIANSALQIYATAGAVTYHGFYRTLAAGTNTQITVSIWAKARNYTHLFLSDLFSARAAVRFNLSTGATDNNFGSGYVSAKATAFPNGWWRCEMVVNVTASTNYGWAFVGVPTSPAPILGAAGAQYAGTGNAADGIYCYGFSVEAGSGASSYIPTGASGVTRTPDLLAVTSTTTMGLNTSEGTFFVETELPRAGTTSPAQFGTPYANGSWLGQFYGAADATTLTANWWGGSGLGLPRSGNPKSLTALSYGLYTGTSIPVSSSLNGAVSTGTFTTSGANNAPNPATWSYISLACNASSLATTSRDNFNGCIKRFKYFPTRLSDAQLQTLTTP